MSRFSSTLMVREASRRVLPDGSRSLSWCAESSPPITPCRVQSSDRNRNHEE